MNDQGTLDTGKAGLRRSQASAGMDQGLRVLSYLISGVLFYGGLGWVGDHFLGTGFLLPVGIVAGAAFGVYVVIRRFGQVPEPVIQSSHATPTSAASHAEPEKTSGPENHSGIDTTEGAL